MWRLILYKCGYWFFITVAHDSPLMWIMSCRWGSTSSSVVKGANIRVKQLFNRRLTVHTHTTGRTNKPLSSCHWTLTLVSHTVRTLVCDKVLIVPHSMNNVAIQTAQPCQVSCPRPRCCCCCCSHELNVLLAFCPIYKLPALKGRAESYLAELVVGHRHVLSAVCCTWSCLRVIRLRTEAVSGPLPHHRSAPQPVSKDLPNKVHGR